jgi:Tfp pilus assembly protein PilE
MRRNVKGVTLTVLVITIIVILILAGVTFNTTTDLLYDSKLKTNITNLRLVQMQAENLYEKYSFDGDTMDTTTMGEKAQASDLSKCNISTSEDWYKWTKDTLANNGLDTEMLSSDTGFFLVNYDTNEVAISKGYTAKSGTKYYTLSDMLNLK